ncbi:Iota toxin protein Ib [Brevibacterium sp. JNUCC-42]|nr:Iota toxin protein Ib [Brevibacterium sp. JNUCC-42]
MKKKSIFKCLTITAVLSQLIVYPVSSYAESNNEKKMDNKTITEEKNSVEGLVGYYFKDAQFNDLFLISSSEQSKLADQTQMKKHNQIFQSVQWMGRIKPSQTGDYILSTPSDSNITLEINGKTVISQGKMENPFRLEKDKYYELKIEYQNTKDASSDLQLFWSIDGKAKEPIPQENLLSPDFSTESKKSKFDGPCYVGSLLDSDCDRIPDKWEENGYTVMGLGVVEWEDSLLAQGYKKYVSNPYNPNTANDPYTDFQKVTNRMPAATKAEARDPLVAAYPAVGVGMEHLIFSKNENVTIGGSGTVSKSVTDSSTNSNTAGGSLEVGWSLKDGFGVKATGHYSHTWGNTTEIENTESSSWSEEIGINTSEAAFLNANVRYYNTGTAPIYQLAPTTNFVFQNAGTSIATIKAGSNQIGNSLGPGDTYPRREQAPISLDKANEDGTVKIAINGEQLDAIQKHEDKLNLQTTQNAGQYGVMENNTLVTDASKQWDPIRTNIHATSGSLILDVGSSKDNLERRVAAREERNPNDKTPEITIGEAIKKAFNAEERDGHIYYTQPNGNEIPLDESAVNLITDEKTKREIENQLNQMQDKKVYNAKWKRGMEITLHITAAYYDFETAGDWEGITRLDGGFTGKKHAQIGPNGNGYAIKDLKLQPYTTYTARAYVKTSSPTGKNNVNFYVDDSVAGNGRGARHHVTIEGDKWQLIEFAFHTAGNPGRFKKLGLANAGNTNLHFDEISVSAWGKQPDGNLIINGDFSAGTNVWKNIDGEITDGYFTGRWIESDSINVKPNTKYELTFIYRTEVLGVTEVWFSSNKGNIIREVLPKYTVWTPCSFDLITGPDETMLFVGVGGLSGAIFSLDNVAVREVK